MTSLTLAVPDLALVSDLDGTRVQIPHLIAQPQNRRYAIAAVQFEGDDLPTPFAGTARTRSYSLTARYTYHEHQEMLDLLDLFETAFDAADSRLLLRTNAFLVDGLDVVEAIVVSDVGRVHLGGQAWDVSFSAQAVNYTPEV